MGAPTVLVAMVIASNYPTGKTPGVGDAALQVSDSLDVMSPNCTQLSWDCCQGDGQLICIKSFVLCQPLQLTFNIAAVNIFDTQNMSF